VNLDGTFQSNEILVNNQQISGNTGSLSFTIPTTALIGNGILRIMSYGTSNATPNPCPGTIAGEVEDYFVSIAPIPNPTNDNILSPFALPNLPVNYAAVNTAGTNATATNGTVNFGGFGAGQAFKDVWYQCTVPSTGVVYLNVTANSYGDHDMQVWKSSNNLPTGALTSIGTDYSSGVGSEPFMRVTETPGTVLFIQIRSAVTNAGGSFNITATYGVNWRGTVSTDWSVSGNWYNDMVPTSTYDVVIPVTTNLANVNAPQTVNNIYTADGVNVVLNDNLTFTGNINVYGTLFGIADNRFRGAGQLIANGTTQSINTSVVAGNFTKAGTGTLTIDAATGTLNIADVLTPSAGTIVTNNKLFIRSYNSGTGATYLSTGQIALGSGTITGDVVIERKIPASAYTSQHYVSAPITSTTNTVYNNYNDDYSVVGSPYPYQYTGTTGPQPTVWPTSWWYDASLTASSASYRWMNGSGKAMFPGLGVSINVPGNTVIDVQGAPVQSDVTLPVTSGQGNLIGNPYPSTIDLDKFLSDNSSNIGGSTVYYNKLGTNVSYSSLAGGTSVPDVYGDHRERFMGHSNGFWINATSSSILFKNTQRDYKPQATIPGALGGTFFAANSSANPNNLRIRVKSNTNNSFDEMLIAKDASTEEGLDNYDASKFMLVEENSQPMIYSILEGQNLVINAMPNTDGKVIPLGVITTAAGNWTIAIHNSDAFIAENGTVTLEDRATGKFYNLNNNPEVAFNLPEGNVGNRFYLHIGATTNNTTTVTEVANNKNLAVYSLNDKVIINFGTEMKGATSVEIFNIAGALVNSFDASSMKGTHEVNMADQAAGAYLVKINNGSDVITKKVMISKK
jgi:hypothetical protein